MGHVQILPDRVAIITLRLWDEARKCFREYSFAISLAFVQLTPPQGYLSNHGLGGEDLWVELWETKANREKPRLIRNSSQCLPTAGHSRSRSSYSPAGNITPPITTTVLPLVQDSYTKRSLGQPIPAAYGEAIRPYRAPQPSAQDAYAHVSTPKNPMSTNAMETQSSETSGTLYKVAGVPVNLKVSRVTGITGIPTNVNQGTVRTEYRGVFVSNLSYDVEDRHVSELFKAFGEIERIILKREDKVNAKGKVVSRSRGNAIVTFKNSQDAQRAIAYLNGRTWNDRTLMVRFDAEATPVDASATPQASSSSARKSKGSCNDYAPLIVDGSKYGRKEK